MGKNARVICFLFSNFNRQSTFPSTSQDLLSAHFDDGCCRILTKHRRCDVEALYSTASIRHIFGERSLLCAVHYLALFAQRTFLSSNLGSAWISIAS